MGDDREARALGAGETIEVDGKQYKLRPIRIQRLCDLERDALRYHKRQVLETYRDNMDLLGDACTSGLMEKKLQEVSEWGVSDLPKKEVYDASNVPVNDKVKLWVKENYDMEPHDFVCQMLLTVGLDRGKISLEQVKEMTGSSPRRGVVRYDQWWITASYEGMVAFVHSSIRDDHPELTKEDIGRWSPAKLVEAAKIAENLTTASMGNG
jgi:hypothetical protein